MGKTAKDILALAEKQIGVHESPAGSCNVKYNTAYYGGKVNNPALAWCAVFIWWLFQQNNAASLFYGGKKTASCETLWRDYKAKGQIVTTPKAGDIIFFDFNRNGSPDHVGIVKSVNSNGSVVTIEGNTSASNQTNGGYVQKKTRAKSLIFALARPKYETPKEAKYKAVMDLNFRKTPDLDGAVIGTVKKCTVLVGTVDKNGWLKTTQGGKAGYVRQKGQKVYMTKL